VLSDGLRVETTLDADLQHAAVAAVHAGLEALDQRNGYRGPLRKAAKDAIDARSRRSRRRTVRAAENAAAPEARAEPPRTRPRRRHGRAREAQAHWRRDRGDEVAQRARVALAPDVRGEVALADAAWPESPLAQKKDRAILAVGDVARLPVLPPEKEKIRSLGRPPRLRTRPPRRTRPAHAASSTVFRAAGRGRAALVRGREWRHPRG
jgi:hypothetical protein